MLEIEKEKFYTIGHRGMEIGAVENSLKAFRKAASLGLNFVELDIQSTVDEEIVVFHDKTLDKKTDLTGKIKDFDLKTIQKTSITTQSGTEKIPSLAKVFEAIRNTQLNLIIEIKEQVDIHQLYAMIKQFKLTDRVFIDSFQHKRVIDFKKNYPDIYCGFLIGRIGIDLFQKKLRRLIAIIKKFDIQAASLHRSDISKSKIQMFKAYNINIFSWGFKKPELYQKYIKIGLNGFTAPDPKKLLIALRFK
jgi:glycerophosphoryl diester phosphodiesterase